MVLNFFGPGPLLKGQTRLTRLEAVVGELAEAQKRTEEELRKLIGEHAETRRQLGGLATTVGYRLEDEAFKALPALLERDHGLVVKGRLTRKFVRDNRGEDIEVNIVGQAERNGRTCTIVGESKSQLSKKDVDAFIRKKLRRLEGVFDDVFPVLVTYMISQPDVEEYAPQGNSPESLPQRVGLLPGFARKRLRPGDLFRLPSLRESAAQAGWR
ncbi:MAG: hypothetical protein HPY58_05870 [Firmicutes bacterium]|nr:hypothetical protein [Bacillota bacterium]